MVGWKGNVHYLRKLLFGPLQKSIHATINVKVRQRRNSILYQFQRLIEDEKKLGNIGWCLLHAFTKMSTQKKHQLTGYPLISNFLHVSFPAPEQSIEAMFMFGYSLRVISASLFQCSSTILQYPHLEKTKVTKNYKSATQYRSNTPSAQSYPGTKNS